MTEPERPTAISGRTNTSKPARPVIGITGPNKGSFFARLAAGYGVHQAGGAAVQLAPRQQVDLNQLDGIIIGGGSDIDPLLYMEESLLQKQYDQERDRFEREILDAVFTCDMPVLGICRGMQLMNVVAGGSLFQDIRERRQTNTIQWTLFPRKPVILQADSNLAVRMCRQHIKVNVLHKQAINKLGEGFDLIASDVDDIPQAIEHKNASFRMGVQWHPEYLPYQSHQHQLFVDLVNAAKRRRTKAND